MAMAAVRFRARRLVAAQPPLAMLRAAVAEEQRRLLPTVIHGLPPAVGQTYWGRFTSGQHACAKPSAVFDDKQKYISSKRVEIDQDDKQKYISSKRAEIDQKKEELFYLLTDLYSKFRLRDEVADDHFELMLDLVGYVKPKPDDRLWCMLRGRRILNEAVMYGTPALVASLIAYDLENFKEFFAFLLGFII